MNGPTHTARHDASLNCHSISPAALTLVASLLAPATLLALGLGELSVSSRLNEPLVAEIRLLAVEPGDLETLETRIAPPSDFAWEGIGRTPFIARLETRPALNAGGEPVLRITSDEPLTEPTLDLLVEVEGTGGRLLREVNISVGPAPPPSIVGDQPRVSGERPRSPVKHPPAAVITGESVPAGPPYPVRHNVVVPAAPPLTGTHYLARPGDTLFGIASRYRPGSRDAVEQLTLEIFESNPDAFINGNIDLLMADAVLRIPVPGELTPEDVREPPFPPALLSPAAVVAPPAPTADSTPDLPVSENPVAVEETPAPAEVVSTAEPAAEGSADAPLLNTRQPDPDIGEEGETSPDARLAIMSREGEKVEAGAYTIASSQYVANLEQTVSLARELAESRGRQVETLQAQQGRMDGVIDKQQRLIDLQAGKIAELQDGLAKARTAAAGERPFGTLLTIIVLLTITLVVLLATGIYLLRGERQRHVTEQADPDITRQVFTNAA
ncbi:MAG: FimV/HubP family polar landmark protein [Pseudomonadota bacterium]|nr:FimV/HubP family polar landmark protein [Pseudomonadota bacterium]